MPFTMQLVGNVIEVELRGELTVADLAGIAAELSALERQQDPTPNRLTNMSAVTGIALDFFSVETFVQARAIAPLRNQVRSAMVAPSPVAFGFARMFQTLNSQAQINFAIFRDEDSARAWLRSASSP